MAKKTKGAGGRPPLGDEPLERCTLMLPRETIEFADNLAAEMCQAAGRNLFTRSTVIRACLQGLQDVEGVEKPLAKVPNEVVLRKVFRSLARQLVKNENIIKDAILASWASPPEEGEADNQA